jgi:glutathionylspermidine synthase
MIRVPTTPRPNWEEMASEFGFKFHTMYGDTYWDESAYYNFTLRQIEEDIEDPTVELNVMCLAVVEEVIHNDELMEKFAIPRAQWDFIRESWEREDPALYARLDLAYNGDGSAKFYENNADTPTSLYETGFWQWLWLENKVDRGEIPANSDQFNILQEKLVNRFAELKVLTPGRILHFSCCKDTEEDRGTVQYLEDCAKAAGIETKFVFIEDIGLSVDNDFVDNEGEIITWAFKLYPWEFMFKEEYAEFLGQQDIRWIEPPWKSIISNKALLPMLWKMFPGHPNLLPAFFEDELNLVPEGMELVKKPIYSREGANITFTDHRGVALGTESTEGAYGEEGYIYQQRYNLPEFDGNYTLIGSWLIDDEAAGISVREDSGMITQDMSRYLPHIIT